jgi:cell division protein FtsQ
VNASQHLKKILLITVWVVGGAGVMALLIAAIRIKREKTCNGYEIEIEAGREGQGFLPKKDVVQLLTMNGKERIKGKSTREFELQKMEARLERHQWIRDAELFFNNNQVLQVKIKERQPIARVITYSGNSFYIDSSCQRLPLSDKLSARVPVFTSFPSDKQNLKASDRLLIKQIKKLSTAIIKDPFWMAQVSQVDITPKRTFELIPTIGSHVIDFGDASDCDLKFHRLFVFYKQVLSKTGMEKYARINIQYNNQVIGVRNSFQSKADSLKFSREIENLIAFSQKMDTTRNDKVFVTQEVLENTVRNSQQEKTDSGLKYVKRN